MRKITSFEAFKRILYLCMIPLILLAMIIYNLMHKEHDGSQFAVDLTKLLIFWFIISWLLVYKKWLIKLIEIVTIIIISFSHIATVYDTIFNSMAQGKPGAIGVSVIWVPSVIVIFFVILRGKRGLIYSLSIFAVNVAFGCLKFSDITHDYRMTLIQFYLAYLFYIIIFALSHYLFRLFTELESMKRNAFTDSLTRISNRYQIDIWFEENIKKSQEQNSKLSVLFLDVDHFKAINDTFGHKTGDSVLKELAFLIKGYLSKDDHFGRWGGEEFLILTYKSGEEAYTFAESIRKRIKEHYFRVAGKQTVSIGVTEYRYGDTVDSMLSRADTGLYQCKSNGRDQVTLI